MALLSQLSDELAAAVEKVGHSVVRVSGRPRQSASGIVWSPDGAIVTADHVLEQDEVTVGLPDGRDVAARIVGRDAGTDLAVLRVQASGLEPAAPASAARVGALALAVARPGQSVQATLGVVSALGGQSRTWRGGQLDGFIRTDAVLYPGFSGGALVDASGAAIGLSTSHFGQGAGFALPMSTVRRIADQLLAGGRVKRGYLGVTSQPVQLPAAIREKLELEQETGLLLLGVEPGGPAEQAGVLIGDVLIGLGGAQLRDTDDLQRALSGERVGYSQPLQVIRGGEPREIAVTIGERPH